MHGNATDFGLESYARILEGLGLTLALLVSLVLNLAVCSIIWRTKVLLNKPANTFVANLCIANLLMSACVIPFSLATIIKDQHGIYSVAACQGNGFVSVMSSVAIVMTLCCISVDRYIAVTRSTRYKAIVTVKRACYALTVVWGQGLLYASFPLFGWSKYEYHPGTLHCSPDWTEHCSLYIYLAVVGFGVPIIVMVFTYIRIFFAIRKHSRKVSTVRRVSKTGNNACARIMRPLTRRSVNRGLSLSPNQRAENFRKNYDKVATSTKDDEMHAQSQDACQIFSYSLELSDSGSRRVNMNDLVSHDLETRLEYIGLQNTNKESQRKSQRPKQGKMRVGKILKRIHSNITSRNHLQSQLPREYKVAKTGVLLLVSFVILWLPYMVVHVCSAKVNAPPVVFRLSTWLVYMNGVANPILYALCNTTVKLKFKQAISHFCALCCKRRSKTNAANFRNPGKRI